MTKIQLFIVPFFIFIMYGCIENKPEHKPKINIIPQPNNLTFQTGEFRLTEHTELVYLGLDKNVITLIKSIQLDILKSSQFQLEITNAIPEVKHILFSINPGAFNNEEAYKLKVEQNHISIEAGTTKGLFYAYQTLRNLLPFEINSDPLSWVSPCLTIEDAPEYPFRGLHLDVARHFYPIDFLKKQLDIMAFYKLNVFHWHLTDDQGWRIEIKKYPKLTSVGSKRSETLVGHGANPPFKYDNEPYSGYYSQDEIKDLIAYASERHITIIPEIELPGHSLAALSAYPDLGCTNGPYAVATKWGSFDDVICAGKEYNYQFIENIISEIASLFPSETIHIGGDECSKHRWRECQHCQSKMKAFNLNDESDLEHYFINRVQKIVEKHGKKMAGWDEIMTDKTLVNSTVVVCQDNAQFKEVINNGNFIIQSPNDKLYFDHYQADPQNHPLAIGGYTPLKEVYCFNPVPDGLNETELKSIKGVQANCWTEYMRTEQQVEFMLYPRLCAFAELGWTALEHKNWPDFTRRLETHYTRLEKNAINYFYEVPKPIVKRDQINFTQSSVLEFENISDKFNIYYTTNGSVPSSTSTLYTQAIPINTSSTIKAITINKTNNEKSKTSIINFNKLQFQKPIDIQPQEPGLNYAFYQGRFKTVKEIQNISQSRSGHLLHSFTPDSIQKESYGIVYDGFINIEQKGIYEFAIASDDGSAFYIGDKLVVNNDGIHGNKTENGAIALREGSYSIKIYYFQTTGYSNFNLQLTDPLGCTTTLQPKDFQHQ